MAIVQTQFVYEPEWRGEVVDLDVALMELLEEAESYAYVGDFILKINNKQYVVNHDVMDLDVINWNTQKAIQYLKSL